MKAGGKTTAVNTEFAIAQQMLCREKADAPQSACAKELRTFVDAHQKFNKRPHGFPLIDRTLEAAIVQTERHCASKTSGTTVERDAQFKLCTQRVISGKETFRTIFGEATTWMKYLFPTLEKTCPSDTIKRNLVGNFGVCEPCIAGTVADPQRNVCVVPPLPKAAHTSK